MEYLIRFAQVHETFRRPEIEALATLAGVDIEFVYYDCFSPFCIVRAQDNATVRAVTARSILTKDVYELWGQGQNYEEVHAEVRRRTEHRWQDFRDVSFRFDVDVFSWKRSSQEKNDLIQSFAYLGFEGQIRMRQPDEVFCILEDHFPEVQSDAAPQEISSLQGTEEIKRVYFGRWLDRGGREAMVKYDLKKRRYISTTSMDAELSLITANMAHAAPGKLFFDPFVGTGGFLVAAAHFGAMTLGADIDPRSFRGKQEITKDNPIGVFSNFNQYGIERHFIDCLSSDLTNSPLRDIPFLDGIVTDPPYGVREGLRVLGTRDGSKTEPIYIDGVPAHTRPGFVTPKKPYGFVRMQYDILDFAARTLVEGGRIAMWMPTSNDQDVELMIPTHPSLEIVAVSVQDFGSWSRRLLTYQKLPAGQISSIAQIRQRTDESSRGVTADELNHFRRKYFKQRRFKTKTQGSPGTGTSIAGLDHAATSEPPTSELNSLTVTEKDGQADLKTNNAP